MLADQKEPVAAVSNVTYDASKTRNLDCNFFRVTIARHIGYSDAAISVKFCLDHADGRFNFMNACSYSAHVFKSFDQSDRAVAAHPEVADVVKKDHACCRTCIDRIAKQRSDDRIMPARFAHDRGTQAVMVAAKVFQPFCH